MYNGIMDDSGRGSTQTWERSWTTEEMRKQSSHWNLAGDAGLLQFLQDFSQKMISKTHEVEQMVNSLCHETKVTNAKVCNIVNDFHMLSNTQFVESRVYDEDIQEVVKEEKIREKSKQERENEVVEKISNALSLGLTVMDQAFERVEFQDSDSEDEDSPMHREVLLQPKDPYFQRLLPHLIGSHAFLQDDYVGIADISSEDDEEVKNEKEESDISSDDDSVPEIHSNQLKLPHRDEYESESVSGGSDMFNDRDEKDELFDESSQSSDDEGLPKTGNRQDEVDNSARPPLLAEELDARIKHYSEKSPKKSRKNSETQSIKSRQSVRTASKSAIKAPSEEDLFGSTIADDEDNDLFGKKGGLFSGTGKLFDESQENSGLFAEVPKSNTESKVAKEDKLLTPKSRGYTQSGKKIPVGGVSAVGGNDMFGEGNENEFKKPPPAVEKKQSIAEPPKKVEPAKVPIPQKPTGGLFDSDDNDDDLFTAPRKPSITSQASKDVKVVPKSKPPKDGAGLFSSDEEDSDLFNIPKTTSTSNVPTSTEKKKPTGGVSVFGTLANEIGNAIKSKRPQGDSDSDTEKSEDISESRDSASLKSHSSYQAKKANTKDSRSNSVSSNSLFADDPEIDDLFTKKEPVKKPSKISASLFGDDDEDDFESLFSSKAAPKSSQSSLPAPTQTKAASKTLSLFEDIDEEDLFSTKPSTSEAVRKPATIPEKKEDKPEIIKEVPKDIPPPKISLFDDSQDDDLFSTSSKLSRSPGSLDKSPDEKSPELSKPSEPPKVRSTSLFDDDVLFGDRNEESPEVDLFKSTPSADKNTKTNVNENKPAVPTSSPSKKPIGGVALFGGVDLFGGQSSLKPTSISQEEPNEISELDESEPVISSQSESFKRPPMLKDTKEISVSFDEPVDISNTLQSAAKDRVKVQTKRRPPSRRGRQAAATHQVINQLPESKEDKSEKVANVPDTPNPIQKFQDRENRDSLSKSSPNKEIATNASAINKPTPFLAVTADFRSPSTEEEDLFSVMDPPDKGLFSNTREKVKKSVVSSKPTVEEPIDSDADLFGSGLNPHPVSTKTVEPVQETVSSKGPQDLFKKCNKPQQSQKNRSIFDDDEDDDDIFSAKKGTNDNDGKTSLSAKVKDSVITDADVDDIFKSVPSKKEKTPKFTSMSNSIFDDDDDDSDIFSTKTVTASSSKTNSTGNIKQAIKSTGKRKESLVKKTVKHTTDVFDDPLLAAQNDQD